MQERRLKVGRRRPPQPPEALAASLSSRGLPRRVSSALLAAVTGTIEAVAATADPVVEATADFVRGLDPAREQERLATALRNLDAAMRDASIAVRAALDELERGRARSSRHR